MPESPQFQDEHGRHDEADAMLCRIESRYSRELPPVGETEALSAGPAAKARFSELWSRTFRQRTTTIWIVNFCLVFTYYGIFTWLPSLVVDANYQMSIAFELMIFLSLAQFPGKAIAAWLIERVGRKRVIVPFCVFNGISAFLLGVATGVNALIPWGCVLSFINAIVWGPIMAPTVESYPTRARSTRAGAANAFARAGGVFAPVMVGFLLSLLQGDRGTIFAILAISMFFGALVVGVLGEETSGRSLEEIAA